MVRFVDVAIIPSETTGMEADCFVVVDLLRATTTIATLFERGLARLTAVASVDEARRRAGESGALLLGEVGGLPPAGFDFGNSPLEALTADLREREAVMVTTNGTRSLCTVAGRGVVLTGALANIGAVCGAAAEHDRVVLVCAGNRAGEALSLEDLVAAGAMLENLRTKADGVELGDGARVAAAAWAAGLDTLVRTSAHARTIAALGFGPDIEFALRQNTSAAAPRITAHGDGWAELSASSRG